MTQTAGQNRNRAFAVATGEIVSFFDADDEMHPQRLQIIEEMFEVRKIISHSDLSNISRCARSKRMQCASSTASAFLETTCPATSTGMLQGKFGGLTSIEASWRRKKLNSLRLVKNCIHSSQLTFEWSLQPKAKGLKIWSKYNDWGAHHGHPSCRASVVKAVHYFPTDKRGQDSIFLRKVFLFKISLFDCT